MTADDLRALAQRIRDAVAHRLPRGLRQVDVVCEARGIRTRETIAGVAVRVGDWHVSARVVLDEHDTDRAARECVALLRERIEARRRWHETMTAACDDALAAMGEARDG